MKIYRLAKSIQLPPQVDQQIRSILPLVNQYIEKAQKHSEPYVYDLGSINFVDPYTQQHRGIPIIVSNVDAETYQKPNAYAAYCPDEGPYGSIYIYMAQDMSTLYRALVHETIHAIDPKMSKDNLIANEKNKQYELQLHERDAFMGTVTNSIKQYLMNIKQKDPANYTATIDALNNWLRSSQLQHLPNPFTSIIDTQFMETYLKDPQSLKLLKQRIYQAIVSI